MSRRRGPARAAAAVPAIAVLLIAGCGGSSGTDDASAPSSRPPPAEQDSSPVIDDDFPDPDVLQVDGTYYAYATNSNARHVRVASSTDLESWEILGRDALPHLPDWVIPGKTWAPEVTEVAPGQFVMYATMANFQPSRQCIGVATASSPEGPFEVVGDGMLVCPADEGGAIDASTFLDDDGTRYLLWKNDGNCCGLDTWLYIAPLRSDGLALAGPATRLVKQDLPWEGHLVEAPTLVKREGRYVLLYSANDYGGRDYAVGYATADSVTGSYTKSEQPLLTSETFPDRFLGPGGQDVVTAPDGSDRLVFHSWYGGQTYRGMNVLALSWDAGRPVVSPPEPG